MIEAGVLIRLSFKRTDYDMMDRDSKIWTMVVIGYREMYNNWRIRINSIEKTRKKVGSAFSWTRKVVRENMEAEKYFSMRYGEGAFNETPMGTEWSGRRSGACSRFE